MRTVAWMLVGACALLGTCPVVAEESETDWAAIADEIQARPGDVAHALPRLEQLLKAPAPLRDAALRQLVALARLGMIPKTHDRLFDALYESRRDHVQHNDRLFEGSLMRDALVELGGENLRTELIFWGLILKSGDDTAAADGFRPYAARLGGFHQDQTANDFLQYFDRDKGMTTALARSAEAGITVADPAEVVAAYPPGKLVEAIAESVETGLPVSDRYGTVVNPWWLLRAGFPSLDAAARTALSERQADRVSALSTDEGAVLATWRRQPYAPKAQRAVLDVAWRHLVAGRRILAEAGYHDVLAVAVDEALVLEARRGLWLCWAGDSSRRSELSAALDSLAGPVPWGEQERSPDALRKLLLPEPAAADGSDLAELRPTAIAAPVAAGWSPALFNDYWNPAEFAGLMAPGLSFQVVDDLVLAAAPRILAVYDLKDPQRPLWTQVASGEWEPERLGTNDRNLASLGPCLPAVADGTIYTRWGPAAVDHDSHHPREALRNRANLRALRQMPNHVAAFDLRSGAMRWSTAGRIAGFEQLVPVTDPVVDGDRVYVFCKDQERQSYRFSLLCLDAADGSLRWAREIGHGGEFQAGGHRSRKDVAWNTAMYGTAPAVRDGIAYWATGGGFVSAIDLRDGLVLWRHDYAITTPDFEVRGSSPVIIDDLLVVLAKDLRGVVTLDRRTGVPVWSNPLLPAAEVVGGLSQIVIMRQGNHVVGVDARSGGVRWTWQASGMIRGDIQQRGDQLVLAMDDRLMSLDLVSGIPGTGVSFPGGSPQASFTVVGDRLLTVSPVLEADGSVQAHDGLLKRATPRLHRGDSWGLLISDDAIEGIDWTGQLRWSRHKPFDLLDAVVVGDQAVILGSREIVGLDAAGRRTWHRSLGRVVGWEVEGGVAVIAQDAPDDDHYSIISLKDGGGLSRVKRESSDHWHHHSRSVVVAVIGDDLHRVVHHVRRNDKRSSIEHVVVPLRGGEERRNTVAEWTGEHWWRADDREGEQLCFATSDGDIHHLDLASGKYRKLGTLEMDDQARRHGRLVITVDAGHCLVELPKDYAHSRQDKDVRQVYRIERDERLYERKLDESLCLIDGEVWSSSRGRLVRLDKSGKDDLAVVIPPTSQGHDFTPLEWRRYGDDLLVVLRRERLRQEVRGKWEHASWGPNDRDHLALDRYGPDGQLRARLMLPHVLPTSWSLSSNSDDHWPHIGHYRWRNEVLWDDQGLWLSARDGVHRIDLAALPERARAGSNTQLLYRLDGRLRIDGRIDDWSSVSHVEQAREGGRLLVTHDRSHLLIAVVQSPGKPLPLRGEGRFGGAGSWLQLDLRGNRSPIGGESWQFDLGLDASGTTVLRRMAPPGSLASVRYDHLTDSLIYELAVPIDPLRDPKERLADEIGLAVSAYRHGQALQEWRHLTLRLHQYTTAQEQAGLSLTAAMPGLSESHLFLRDIIATHIGDWPEGRVFCRQLLAEHRDAPLAAAVLLHLDEVMNGREDGREPDAELIALATEANVAAEQIERYRSSIAEKREHHRSWHQIEWPNLTELDPEQAQSLLEEQVLALGRAPAAVDFLRALRRVRDLDAEGSVALIRWFLERFPDHPEAERLLHDWWSIAQSQAEGDHNRARELMDAGLDAMTTLPWRLTYDFRRSKMHRGHAYVNEWHVVGPFPSLGLMEYDYGVPLPPRLQTVTLKERYRMPDRTLAWQPLTTGSQRIPISHWLGNPLEPSIAYCVTWVKSPDQRQVALELDADGPCRVWVNRHYVHRRESNQDQGPIHVWLAAGWNAILVEQAMGHDGGWTFQLEVVERSGKGVLRDVEFLAANGHKAVTEPVAIDPASLRRGLVCEVFRGEWDKLPDFDLLTPDERKVSEHLDLSVTEHRDHIGLRFTGFVKIDKMDFYTFSTNSDDGSRLLIGDQVVVDNDGLHGAEERFGTVTLKPGYYPITVTMFENQGGELLEVFWRPHGGEKVKLEGQAIWHRQ